MTTSIELRQDRAKLVSESRKILDSATEGKLSAEQQESWDKYQVGIDELGAKIELQERQEYQASVEADLAKSARKTAPHKPETREDVSARKAAYRSWLLGENGGANPDTLDAAARCGINLRSNMLHVNLEQRANMVTTSNAAGGYFVPTDFPQELDRALSYFMPIKSVANFIQTNDGRSLPFVMGDDTSNSGALTAENTGAPSFADPTITEILVKAYKWTAGQKVSIELLRDSVFDVEQYIAQNLAERISRVLDPLFATGAGTTTIQGLATAADSTPAVDLAGGAITADKLIDTVFAVPKQYRNGCAWVMGDTTVAAIRKLKDDSQRYLLDAATESSLGQQSLDTLLGFPVVVNTNMADITDTPDKAVAVFGQIRQHYVVRQVAGVNVIRLDELYRTNGLIGYMIELFLDAQWKGPTSALKKIIN